MSVTVHTPQGSFEIPATVVAQGDAACGAFAEQEVARLEQQRSAAEQVQGGSEVADVDDELDEPAPSPAPSDPEE